MYKPKGSAKSPADIAEAARQTRERREREAKALAEQTRGHNAAIKSGYTPNRETLLVQIEALYADGEISIQEYDWGMAGLDLVFGFVAAAKELTEDEAEMDEFNF